MRTIWIIFLIILCFKDTKIRTAVLDDSDIGDTPKWRRWAERLGYDKEEK